MKGLLLVLAAASVFTLTGSSPAAPAGGKKDTAAIASSNNAFALALYSRLRQREGNLFCSPFSISTALAMTYAGARGETAAEMYRTLCLPLPWGQERLHAAFHELVAELNARQAEGNYELTVANALWGQRGYGFSGAFLELLRASYGAGLREVDFAADPEAARRLINAWVEEQTRRRIKDLVPPGVLSPLTRLVLTNAIYFKGKWDSPFKEAASRPGEFTLAHGGKVEVPMMHQRHRFRYAETAAFQALEMPYAGGELAMLILLPRSAEGIGELEESPAGRGARGHGHGQGLHGRGRLLRHRAHGQAAHPGGGPQGLRGRQRGGHGGGRRNGRGGGHNGRPAAPGGIPRRQALPVPDTRQAQRQHSFHGPPGESRPLKRAFLAAAGADIGA